MSIKQVCAFISLVLISSVLKETAGLERVALELGLGHHQGGGCQGCTPGGHQGQRGHQPVVVSDVVELIVAGVAAEPSFAFVVSR